MSGGVQSEGQESLEAQAGTKEGEEGGFWEKGQKVKYSRVRCRVVTVFS